MSSNRRGVADRERGHGAPALDVTAHLIPVLQAGQTKRQGTG
jgi:hypothetical protein